MIKIDEYRYQADEGNFIVRKADGFIMGEAICLGDADAIDKYGEEPYTDESYEAFYASIGEKSPKAKEAEMEGKREN